MPEPIALRRIRAAYGRFLSALAGLSGLLLLGIMLLVVANTLTRKLFNAPLAGTLELTEVTMPLIVLLPVAFTQMRGGHIHVELVTARVSPGTRRAMLIFAGLASIAFFLVVAWATGRAAAQSLRIGETMWGVLRVPLAPTKIAISFAALLMVVQVALDTLKLVYDGRPGPAEA